jgi:lysophospholipase L1-like esterase
VITVLDFFGLTNDPGNEGKPKQGVFCDEVHPTADTYSQIADIIYEKLWSSN